MAAQPGFRLVDVWYLSVATNAIQAMISLLLIAREFRVRLVNLDGTPAVATAGSAG
jgi:hypothetical protein